MLGVVIIPYPTKILLLPFGFLPQNLNILYFMMNSVSIYELVTFIQFQRHRKVPANYTFWPFSGVKTVVVLFKRVGLILQ